MPKPWYARADGPEEIAQLVSGGETSLHTHPGGVGGDHPDLAAHDALGLALQTELDAHGNAQLHDESHAARHASAGADAIAAADIGAATSGHGHAQLHDALHAATHATAQSDAITPGAIGAAT